MTIAATARAEAPLATKYSLVACIGFVIDLLVLQLMIRLGLQPAWARVISLTTAMQVTFWVNGLFVFRCLTRDGWISAWLGYMVTSSFGNFCNYWTFVTLISLHRPILSDHTFDLAVGGVIAWAINYGCARYLIFGVQLDGAGKSCTPIEEVVRGTRARIAGLMARSGS